MRTPMIYRDLKLRTQIPGYRHLRDFGHWVRNRFHGWWVRHISCIGWLCLPGGENGWVLSVAGFSESTKQYENTTVDNVPLVLTVCLLIVLYCFNSVVFSFCYCTALCLFGVSCVLLYTYRKEQKHVWFQGKTSYEFYLQHRLLLNRQPIRATFHVYICIQLIKCLQYKTITCARGIYRSVAYTHCSF